MTVSLPLPSCSEWVNWFLIFGAIIVIFSVMVILNLLASSSCSQLMKTIGEKERELVKLEDAKMRESTRWEEMKTPERIEHALLRHGLSMKPPHPEQTVRMMANGLPRPGQISLAKAKSRSSASVLAQASARPQPSIRRTRKR